MTNEEKSAVAFHMRAECGIEMRSTVMTHTFVSVPLYINRKKGWAEKRRDTLIAMLVRRRVIRNWIILIAGTIFSAILIVGVSIVIASIFRNMVLSIGLGILSAQGTIVAFILFDDRFERDPIFVKVKHKGKTYSLLWNIQ